MRDANALVYDYQRKLKSGKITRQIVLACIGMVFNMFCLLSVWHFLYDGENYICFAGDWFIPELKILKKERHCVHPEAIHPPDSNNDDDVFDLGELLMMYTCPSKTEGCRAFLEQSEGSNNSGQAVPWMEMMSKCLPEEIARNTLWKHTRRINQGKG